MRLQPYTEIGIKRLLCFRCKKKAHTQWQICADGNQYRPICVMCDIDLNRFPNILVGTDAFEGVTLQQCLDI